MHPPLRRAPRTKTEKTREAKSVMRDFGRGKFERRGVNPSSFVRGQVPPRFGARATRAVRCDPVGRVRRRVGLSGWRATK